MITLAILLVLASVVAISRSRAMARARASVASRLTPGPDGIVVGASTIDLPGDNDRGVLLLHGFGDTPQTLEYLAAYIYS